MKKYVLVFLFSENGQDVALIQKNRPAHLAGLLNGIGGKIEPEESATNAAIREFKEETGVDILPEQMRYFCHYYGVEQDESKFEIHCFMVKSNEALFNVETTTDEPVSINSVQALLNCSRFGRFAGQINDNLKWLIPAALDNYNCFFSVREDHAR